MPKHTKNDTETTPRVTRKATKNDDLAGPSNTLPIEMMDKLGVGAKMSLNDLRDPSLEVEAHGLRERSSRGLPSINEPPGSTLAKSAQKSISVKKQQQRRIEFDNSTIDVPECFGSPDSERVLLSYLNTVFALMESKTRMGHIEFSDVPSANLFRFHIYPIEEPLPTSENLPVATHSQKAPDPLHYPNVSPMDTDLNSPERKTPKLNESQVWRVGVRDEVTSTERVITVKKSDHLHLVNKPTLTARGILEAELIRRRLYKAVSNTLNLNSCRLLE